MTRKSGSRKARTRSADTPPHESSSFRQPGQTKTASEQLECERERILQIWESRVRQELPAAKRQGELALINSLPKFLAQMSEALSERILEKESKEKLEDAGEEHGENRADLSSYSLEQMLLEYRILREVVFAVLDSEHLLVPTHMNILFDSFQTAMTSAASEFFRIKLFREQIEQLKTESYAKNLKDLQSVTEAAIAKNSNFQDLLHSLLERIQILLQCDTVMIYLISEDEKELITCASIGLDEDVKNGMRIPVIRGIPGAILGQGDRHLLIEDLGRSGIEILSPSLRESQIHSVLGAKLMQETRLIGVMHIGRVESRAFQADEIKLFELVAERIGFALANSRLYEKAQEELTRFKTDDVLRARLLSHLAHDIRNPLTAAQMNAQLLVRSHDKPKLVKDLSGRVIEGIRRADSLVKDLLDVNRTLSGRSISVELMSCDLNTIIATAMGALTPRHGDRFVYHTEQHPLQGVWSPSDLQRGFEQLFKVSLQCSDSASPIVITAQTTGGKTPKSEQEARIRIEFGLEGGELSAQKMKNLSELLQSSNRSYEAQESRQSGRDGSLELILAKGIIHAHGGGISLLVEKGKSGVLSVVLPLNSSADLELPGS